MELKKTLKSNNLTRYLTIGGIGAAILGISYFLVKRSKKKQLNGKETNQTASIDKDIPKEIVLKLLRELRKAYYPILKEIYLECVKEAAKWGDKLPNDAISSIYEMKSADVVAVRNKICAKYGISESDMDQISLVLYKNDPDVQRMDALIGKDFAEVVKGNLCNETTIIPEFLTPQRVLKIMAINYQRCLHKTSELLQEIGKNYEELKADAALTERKERLHQEVRIALLIEEGLDDFDDHPDKIYDWAKIQYSKINEYRIKVDEMTAQTQAILPRLHIKDEDLAKAIEEIGKDILENRNDETQTTISITADKI